MYTSQVSCRPTTSLPLFTRFSSLPPLLSFSETFPSWFHPSTALEPRGLKIDLINIACFDRFNINAKIVTHQIFIPQCCPSRLLPFLSAFHTPTQLVWQTGNSTHVYCLPVFPLCPSLTAWLSKCRDIGPLKRRDFLFFKLALHFSFQYKLCKTICAKVLLTLQLLSS